MDSSLYSIPPLTQALVVKDNAGQTTFTVNNATDKALSTEFQIEATAPAKAEWFQVERPFRVMPPKGAEQVKVTLAAPPDADGTGSFTIVAIWRERSEEFRTRGAAVGVTLRKATTPAPAPTPTKMPWWIWLLIAGFVLLLAGILTYALWPKGCAEGETVKMPPLIGVKIEEATAQLKKLGLEIVESPVKTGSGPVGTVVDQNVRAGVLLACGQAVTVDVRR
jgi:PASTA domain